MENEIDRMNHVQDLIKRALPQLEKSEQEFDRIIKSISNSRQKNNGEDRNLENERRKD